MILWLATHWRLLLALSLALAFAWQVRAKEEAQDALSDFRQSVEQAGLKSQLQGAQSGVEAVTTYVEQNEADRPVVERVVERVRHVCLRPEGRVPVPASPGTADEAPGRTSDDEFAKAIGQDLATCKAELNRLGALQVWVKANGG
ncbi:MAG TPA: hypothetical protein VFZ38_10725 [Vicinamibacterales bacterium]